LTIILNTPQGLPEQIVTTETETTYQCKKYNLISKDIKTIRFKNCGTVVSVENNTQGGFEATFCIQNGEDINVTLYNNTNYVIDTTTGDSIF